MTAQINKIIFTGDFLRLSVAGFKPTQHENIQWLADLLERPLSLASNLPIEVVNWDNRTVNESLLDQGFIKSVYEALKLPLDIHSWPFIYGMTDVMPDSLEYSLLRFYNGGLVIGFELPPYLKSFFDRNGIYYINCEISPIRFMDDLLIRFESNSVTVNQSIKQYEVNEDEVLLYAGLIKSGGVRRLSSIPSNGTLLLLLQTKFDKVLIDGKGFAKINDYIDDLYEVSQNYTNVLVKHHPLQRQDQLNDIIRDSVEKVSVTNENFYNLVSHDNVEGVIALSSGCLDEAKYFGKNVHCLMRRNESNNIVTTQVKSEFYNPDFWRDILSDLVSVTSSDGIEIPFRANRLRKLLGISWGYNEIDTDILLKWGGVKK